MPQLKLRNCDFRLSRSLTPAKLALKQFARNEHNGVVLNYPRFNKFRQKTENLADNFGFRYASADHAALSLSARGVQQRLNGSLAHSLSQILPSAKLRLNAGVVWNIFSGDS